MIQDFAIGARSGRLTGGWHDEELRGGEVGMRQPDEGRNQSGAQGRWHRSRLELARDLAAKPWPVECPRGCGNWMHEGINLIRRGAKDELHWRIDRKIRENKINKMREKWRK